MRLLSLILVPLIFALAFFAAYTPVEADCIITAFPASIAPGATIAITVQGEPDVVGSYAAWLQDSNLNFIPIGPASSAADASGIANISFTAPTIEGDYTLGINETILLNPPQTCTDRQVIYVDTNAPTVSNPNEPATIGGIVTIIKNIIKLLVPIAALAFLVMMIIGGFQFMLSGGDPKAAGAARSTLTFAIIGIILVIISWLLLLLIKNVTGVNVTTVEIPGISP